MATIGLKEAERDGNRIHLKSLSGLVVDASISSADGVFNEFYSDYDAAFVLKDEKEGFDGFAACLALNSGEAYDSIAGRLGASANSLSWSGNHGRLPALGGPTS